MSNPHGQFVWHELITTDADAAIAFYGEVVGWTARDSGQTAMRYDILHAGETPMGGIMAMPMDQCPGGQPGWLGYIAVSDVDVYADKVKQAGGAVLMGPHDIPGVGRFAVAAEPHGAAFVLFKANEGAAPPPAAAVGTPGMVGWNELSAGDGPSAFDFYSGLFGWTRAEAMPMGDLGVYQLFAAGADAIGAIMTKTPDTPAPMWLYYFNVNDIDRAVERVKRAGGQVVLDPMEVPGPMWVINGVDPQGAMFALLGPRS